MSTPSDTELDDDQKDGKTPEDLLAIARQQYKVASDACGDNYEAALADLTFLQGGTNQWDEEAARVRAIQKRPMITVNVLPTYLHQVTNDQRMNTPSIKVHPVDDDADEDTAKVIQGLIKHIEYDSNADVAEDTAVNSAAAIGFGWFRLVTEYCSEDSFDQDIKFKRIRNALSVKIDPLSVEPDGSDMRYAFVEFLMDKEEFKRKYPDANAGRDSFFNDGNADQPDMSVWIQDDTVLVCEWYRIETENVEVVQLSTGETGFADDLMPDGDEKTLPEGIVVVNRRDGERSKVMWRRITGYDVLEETEIMCKWIPVFPVYGDEIDIQGQVVRSGIVRNAKGPAQMYNVFMTSATEEVALRGKNPWVMAEGQEQGHEDEWQQINVTPMPYVTYKPVTDGGLMAPPPQRQPMADVPVGHLQMAMHSADNIKKTTGLFDASLGARGNATSGVQERAQQREGDVANYHYMDGLLRTLRHVGRCLVDMIPHYYDTKRTIRILGENDEPQHVTINEPNPEYNELNQTVAKYLNDVTVGKYDVTVSSGPSFTTMRQEAGEFFANALSASKDPAQASVMGYLAIKNQDIKDGETATKMLATLLPPPAKAVLDEENGEQNGEEQQMVQTPKGPLPVAQVPQVLDMLEQRTQALQQALEKVDADKAATERAKAEAQLAESQRQAQLDAERLRIEQQDADTRWFAAQKEADEAEAKLLLQAAELQLEAKAIEGASIDGQNAQALEAYRVVLEHETKRMLGSLAAQSADRRAQFAASAAERRAQLTAKQQPRT